MGISELLTNMWLITFLRFVLGSIFIFSGISKYPDRQRFELLVVAFDVLPQKIAQLYGHWLPWVEVAIGVLLILGMATVLAAVGSAILLVSFTIAIALNLLRHRTHLGCGCFGTQHVHRIGPKPLARNIFLLTLSGIVLLGAPGSLAIDRATTVLHSWRLIAIPWHDVIIIGTCIGTMLVSLPLLVRAYRLIRI